MFKIAVETGGPEEVLGVDATYRLIKECGFDAVDANIDHLMNYGQVVRKEVQSAFRSGLSEKEMLEYFRPWGDAAKKYSLDNYQAHAPFPSYHPFDNDPAYNDWLIEMLKKTIVGCASIDCHQLIVHPFFYDYEHKIPFQDEWNINIDRYMRLAETAKRENVTINLENMFTRHNNQICAAVCNDGKEAAAYIDTLNDAAGEKIFGFCLDTGHALLAKKDIYRFMVDLGDRINAFHVHDNNGLDDQHLAPYMGVMDWDDFIRGLKAIEFNKTMDFETFNIWQTMDHEICPDMMKIIAKTGRMFARRAAE